MAKRRYSDNDKAAALAVLDANGGNVNGTAKQLNIPGSTLDEWQKGRVNDAVPNIREQKKGELSERLDEIAHRILDVLPDKLNDASAQQLATALGIVVDKMQLLAGKPTQRTETAAKVEHGVDENSIERLAEIARILDDVGAIPDYGTSPPSDPAHE